LKAIIFVSIGASLSFSFSTNFASLLQSCILQQVPSVPSKIDCYSDFERMLIKTLVFSPGFRFHGQIKTDHISTHLINP